MALEHGGRLLDAIERFGIPEQRWLDLSTGISPWSWPVPAIPESVWRQLPDDRDGLEAAAAAHYGCRSEAVLAVPGSQYALQHVPLLLPRGRVALPRRGYAEHRAAWQRAGHAICDYTHAEDLRALVRSRSITYVVVINPNNPTGDVMQPDLLRTILRRLEQTDGCLLVDEAFADATPELSLAADCPRPGLVVYRSVGKFFGLAGLRLGFLLATPGLRDRVCDAMPPWAVSNPARWLGARALADTNWQAAQRRRLTTASAAWSTRLRQLVPALQWRGTALFASGSGPVDACRAMYLALGRRGVLVRQFDDGDGQGMLRLGLPARAARARIDQLLAAASRESVCAA